METFNGIKKGQKFKVISNSNSHNYPMDKVLTFRISPSGTMSNNVAKEVIGNSLSCRDIIIISITLEDLKKELESNRNDFIKSEKEILSKISFCEKTGSIEYDEEIFKIYSVLNTLNEYSNDIEKAKKIANILKN